MTSESAKAILIVDDEASLRNTFRIFLQRAGYGTVKAVATFDEAIHAVSARNFDCVICDIVLESASGIELVKRFRELGVTSPVVIVTGYPQVETASEAVRLGAFDYLAKPVEKEALLNTTRLAVRESRLEQEKREAEHARECYRRFLETLFKSVSDSIISVDRELKVLKMNRAAEQLFGAMRPPLREGDPLSRVCLDKGLCRITENVSRVLTGGAEVTDHRLECFADGNCKVLSICISPLHDEGGEPTGAVLVMRDMTQKESSGPGKRSRFYRLIGASPAMEHVFMMIENIARVDSTVLITGESGTGKELAVHALHRESPRRDRPLVMVDCTAMPENLLESELFGHRKGAFTGAEENRRGRILQAEGGTLFLDEIGDISTAMQLRLLRFLQEKTFYPVGSDTEVRVDVRVVAATNADLKAKVAGGTFREDLYYRLLIIDIRMPPLRDRTGDIALLCDFFIRRFARSMRKAITGISQQAMELLGTYRWPGNVRQLEHVIERAAILCAGPTISCTELPEEIRLADRERDGRIPPVCVQPSRVPESPCDDRLGEEQRQIAARILAALETAGGNKAKAARLLNIDRSTLYRKMHELHIDMQAFV